MDESSYQGWIAKFKEQALKTKRQTLAFLQACKLKIVNSLYAITFCDRIEA